MGTPQVNVGDERAAQPRKVGAVVSDDRSDRMQPPSSADTRSDGVAEPHVQPAISRERLLFCAGYLMGFSLTTDDPLESDVMRDASEYITESVLEKESTGLAQDTRDSSAG